MSITISGITVKNILDFNNMAKAVRKGATKTDLHPLEDKHTTLGNVVDGSIAECRGWQPTKTEGGAFGCSQKNDLMFLLQQRIVAPCSDNYSLKVAIAHYQKAANHHSEFDFESWDKVCGFKKENIINGHHTENKNSPSLFSEENRIEISLINNNEEKITKNNKQITLSDAEKKNYCYLTKKYVHMTIEGLDCNQYSMETLEKHMKEMYQRQDIVSEQDAVSLTQITDNNPGYTQTVQTILFGSIVALGTYALSKYQNYAGETVASDRRKDALFGIEKMLEKYTSLGTSGKENRLREIYKYL